MPKQKTHSGAKKLFKITGSGKLMKQQANLRHNFEGKPTKRTRRLSPLADVVENQDHAPEVAQVVQDRGLAVVDRDLPAVPREQDNQAGGSPPAMRR